MINSLSGEDSYWEIFFLQVNNMEDHTPFSFLYLYGLGLSARNGKYCLTISIQGNWLFPAVEKVLVCLSGNLVPFALIVKYLNTKGHKVHHKGTQRKERYSDDFLDSPYYIRLLVVSLFRRIMVRQLFFHKTLLFIFSVS